MKIKFFIFLFLITIASISFNRCGTGIGNPFGTEDKSAPSETDTDADESLDTDELLTIPADLEPLEASQELAMDTMPLADETSAPKYFALTIKITDKETSEILTNAIIKIYNESNELIIETEATVDIPSGNNVTLDPGKYYLTIEKEGYISRKSVIFEIYYEDEETKQTNQLIFEAQLEKKD